MNPDELNTTTNTTNYVDDYALALDSVPPEVRAFMWSDAFNIILKVIGDTYNLNGSQREVLKMITMETLVGTITPISRRTRLVDVGIVGDTQDKILDAINEEIISRALVQVEEYNDLHKEGVAIEESRNTLTVPMVTNAPNPAQALVSIKERLSQASSVATTKRDYSVERTETPASQTQNTPKPVFDIYREPPTK